MIQYQPITMADAVAMMKAIGVHVKTFTLSANRTILTLTTDSEVKPDDITGRLQVFGARAFVSKPSDHWLITVGIPA